MSVLLHSLAFGTLKPFFAEPRESAIAKPQIEMTLDVMAQLARLLDAGPLLRESCSRPGARIFAMTSAGDHIVWPAYGAVSAAKSALESYVRQLAVELAPHGVAVNALRAGRHRHAGPAQDPGQRGHDRARRRRCTRPAA